MRDIIMQEQIAKIATGVSYTVSSGTFTIGMLTVNEWAAIFGVILAFATFIMAWVYKHKHYKLAKAVVEKSNTEDD